MGTTSGSKTTFGSKTGSKTTSRPTTSKQETEEEDNIMTFTFQKNEEKIVYVKKKPPFKCPMEDSCRTSKNGKSFREHLSRHFASNIKKDFPFFQENGKYICPIVDCEFLGLNTYKLISHINLDHEQINSYLRDEGLDNIKLLLLEKKKK